MINCKTEKKYLTKLQCQNELIFKYMIFNIAAWQVTFFSDKISVSKPCGQYIVVQLLAGELVACSPPCDGRYNTC